MRNLIDIGNIDLVSRLSRCNMPSSMANLVLMHKENKWEKKCLLTFTDAMTSKEKLQ